MFEQLNRAVEVRRRWWGIKRAQWRIEKAIQSAANITISGEGSLKTSYALAERVAERFNMNPENVKKLVNSRVKEAASSRFMII